MAERSRGPSTRSLRAIATGLEERGIPAARRVVRKKRLERNKQMRVPRQSAQHTRGRFVVGLPGERLLSHVRGALLQLPWAITTSAQVCELAGTTRQRLNRTDQHRLRVHRTWPRKLRLGPASWQQSQKRCACAFQPPDRVDSRNATTRAYVAWLRFVVSWITARNAWQTGL